MSRDELVAKIELLWHVGHFSSTVSQGGQCNGSCYIKLFVYFPRPANGLIQFSHRCDFTVYFFGCSKKKQWR